MAFFCLRNKTFTDVLPIIFNSMPLILVANKMFTKTSHNHHVEIHCLQNIYTNSIPFNSLSIAPLERCLPVLCDLFVCFKAPARCPCGSTPIFCRYDFQMHQDYFASFSVKLYFNRNNNRIKLSMLINTWHKRKRGYVLTH